MVNYMLEPNGGARCCEISSGNGRRLHHSWESEPDLSGPPRAAVMDGGTPNSFAWVDGTTPWWPPEEEIIDWHRGEDIYVFVTSPVEGQGMVFDATFEGRAAGVLCKARDVGAIRGAMPSVVNLGTLPPHAVPQDTSGDSVTTCEMTEWQLGLVQGVVAGFNASCTYRVEVGPAVARVLP